MNYLYLFALISGAAIAIQASINSRLGVLLDNALIATTVAFVSGGLILAVIVMVVTKNYPQYEVVRAIPIYLWFSGGALGAFGVGMFYFLIPKMGVGPMMSFALTGQIVVAIAASHFGWFDLPTKEMNVSRLTGVISLIAGTAMINWE